MKRFPNHFREGQRELFGEGVIPATEIRPMSIGLSPKQAKLYGEICERKSLTLDRAVELVGGDYYTNARFHVGTILSRMVARKLIVREKPGHFVLP